MDPVSEPSTSIRLRGTTAMAVRTPLHQVNEIHYMKKIFFFLF